MPRYEKMFCPLCRRRVHRIAINPMGLHRSCNTKVDEPKATDELVEVLHEAVKTKEKQKC